MPEVTEIHDRTRREGQAQTLRVDWFPQPAELSEIRIEDQRLPILVMKADRRASVRVAVIPLNIKKADHFSVKIPGRFELEINTRESPSC
jgi:hypothetical protein